MDREALLRQLRETFLAELDDHVESMNSRLLEYERESDAATRKSALDELYRAAHSLKGASRAISASEIELACHQLESILSGVRDGERELSGDVLQLAFVTADALGEVSVRMRAEDPAAGSVLLPVIPALDDAASKRPFTLPARRRESRPPASRPESQPAQSRPPTAPPGPPNASAPAAPDSAPAEHAPPPSDPPEASGGESEPDGRNRASEAPETAPRDADAPTSSRAASRPGRPGRHRADTVRVRSRQLDSLLGLSDELVVNRRRVGIDAEEIESLAKELGALLDPIRPSAATLLRLADHRAHSGDALRFGPGRHDEIRPDTARNLALAIEGLDRLVRRATRAATNLKTDLRRLQTTADPLDDEIRRIRMLSFMMACAGLERAVRDVAVETGKWVRLDLEGDEVLLDRAVVDGLRDPLLHLVRNSVDHGIETPNERGEKPGEATVRVSARLAGNLVRITVEDDGRGLDLDRIRARAEARGIEVPGSDEAVARLVFSAGFSTAAIITNISGRGMGLNIVAERLEQMQGTVDVSSVPGEGTTFTLTVPLSLTNLRAVLVECSGQKIGIPASNVERLLRMPSTAFETIGGVTTVSVNQRAVPVAQLSDLLKLPRSTRGDTPVQSVAVLKVGSSSLAVIVDALLDEQPLILKSLGRRLKRVPMLVGGAVLPSGDIALVLNGADVVKRGADRELARPVQRSTSDVVAKRILVVDDSITTRSLERAMLEAHGYRVEMASDGEDAWAHLVDSSFDLVVSDVEMPRLDGLGLTRRIRSSDEYKHLPVILLTSLATKRDRERGARAGADAYLVKSTFDQSELLATIEQLL